MPNAKAKDVKFITTTAKIKFCAIIVLLISFPWRVWGRWPIRLGLRIIKYLSSCFFVVWIIVHVVAVQRSKEMLCTRSQRNEKTTIRPPSLSPSLSACLMQVRVTAMTRTPGWVTSIFTSSVHSKKIFGKSPNAGMRLFDSSFWNSEIFLRIFLRPH